MAEKVTMELEVNLECDRCYKKVKKILCKIPEIQDTKYNEKENKVTITVVSCRPEKIRDQLYCKGKGCIRCIKIVPKPKPEPAAKPKPDPKPEDDKQAKKPANSKEPAVPGYPPMYPINEVIGICLVPYCVGYGVRGRCNHACGKSPGPCYPINEVIGICLVPYCVGYGVRGRCNHACGKSPGPCYDGCGCGCGGSLIRLPPPCCLVPYCEGYGVRGRCNHACGKSPGPCYDGCGCGCGGSLIRLLPPCYDGCGCGCGGGGGFYVNRPYDHYFCEENPRCAIM